MFLATPIEDPSGQALTAFHAALSRAEAGQGRAHVIFYGGSHVASDLYTDVVRVKLQQRFGDAGPGFVLPAKPRPAYRNAGIDIEKSAGLRGLQVKAAAPLAGRYGLAGICLTTRHKPAFAAFTTRAHAGLSGHAARFELYYLKQPGGGKIRVSIDGQLRELSSAAGKPRAAYELFEVSDGVHRVELSMPDSAPVQIFGMSVERDQPGVVLDTLGIPGSRAAYHLLWDDTIYREQLARRTPDLVVLAYGTNEAGDDDVPISSYEASLRKVVSRVHEVAPAASCVLVGPSDRPLRNEDGTLSPRPRTAEIIETQRKVAADSGCGFFDTVTFMGGPMAMQRWVSALPPFGTPDHVHFTRIGYEALGRTFYDSLMQGYAPLPPPNPPEPARLAPAEPMLSVSPGTPRSP